MIPQPRLLAPIVLLAGVVFAQPALANGLVGAGHCIAHAGASDHAPAHTMAAYELALQSKAQFIEPDVQLTKDGVLVCLHDNSLERTTNVEDVFPNRARVIKTGDETQQTWPVIDFTLEEIKKLDAGSWFDPSFAEERVPSLQELIDLARGKKGLYPETKDPDFYQAQGVDIDLALHELLVKNGLDQAKGQRTTPIMIQSFHRSSLERLKQLGGGNYQLIQLVWIDQYNDFLSDEGLDQVATYAHGVSPFLSIALADRTLLERAHSRDLAVHTWTMFEAFPPKGFDTEGYIAHLLSEKVDGLFVHSPELCP